LMTWRRISLIWWHKLVWMMDEHNIPQQTVWSILRAFYMSLPFLILNDKKNLLLIIWIWFRRTLCVFCLPVDSVIFIKTSSNFGPILRHFRQLPCRCDEFRTMHIW
jgi:signal transduction histidine kinase